MPTISLLFSRFDSPIGRIIAWGTEGDIGHVDVILPDGRLLGAQQESGLGGMPEGVQIRPANYLATSGGTAIYRIDLATSEEIATEAYDWVQKQAGCSYDIEGLAGIALGKDWSIATRFICSGLVMGMLTQPTHPLITNPIPRNWRIITPEQLLLICSVLAPIQSIGANP